MIVRHPKKSELERAGEVGCIAFESSDMGHWVRSFERRAEIFGLDYLFVVEVDGRIVSSALCTPTPIWCGGDIVAHAAVGGVATLPEYRKLGCAGAMMTQIVRRLRELGVHTSSLWPFSFAYYRKFGWELACERRRYVAKPEVLQAMGGDPSTVMVAAQSDLPRIMRLYNSTMPGYAGMTVRDDRWWRHLLDEFGIVLGDRVPEDKAMCLLSAGSEEVADAYAFCRILGEGDDRRLQIEELAAASPHAALAVLARAAQEQVGSITTLAPSDDPLLQQLEDPRSIEARVEAGYQFRVIDPPAAIASRKPQPGRSGRLRFELTDPVFAEGWRFTVELDAGRMAVSQADTLHSFSTSVAVFARLFTGYLRPTQAVQLGFGSVSTSEAISLAESAFLPMTSYRSGLEPG